MVPCLARRMAWGVEEPQNKAMNLTVRDPGGHGGAAPASFIKARAAGYCRCWTDLGTM